LFACLLRAGTASQRESAWALRQNYWRSSQTPGCSDDMTGPCMKVTGCSTAAAGINSHILIAAQKCL
jgi:hypothetical protein